MQEHNPKPDLRQGVVPDLAAAARFLRLLDPVATEFEFRTFDDNIDRDHPGLTKTFHGSLDRHGGTLQRLNQQGAGVFVTINQTNGKGRRAEDIIRVRAVFVDLDGAPLAPVMSGRVPPHIIVETSAQRWHCYWLVEDMALQDFTPVQLALIQRFDADKSIHDLPRVMRLPGFVHAKIKNQITSPPFLSRIIHTIEQPPYPAKYFEQIPTEVYTPDRVYQVSPMDEWKAAAALEVIPNDNLEWEDWNEIGLTTWRATGGSKYGFEAFDGWSHKSSKYNSTTTKKYWKGYTRFYTKYPPVFHGVGTLVMLADQADPEWRERFRGEVLAEMAGGRS